MNIKSWIKEKKPYNLMIIIAFLVAIILILSYGFNGTKDQEVVSINELFNEDEGLVVQGVIETKEVNINSKVAGKVIEIYVEEGQQVKEGDPLVEISSDELQAKKKQAEAALTQAKAALKASQEQLEQVKAGVNAANGLVAQAQAGVDASAAKLNEAEAGVKASQKQYEAACAVKEKADNGARTQEVAQAQAAYDVMQKSYDRVLALVEKGAVSQQKLDEIKAQLEVAKETLSMAEEGAREEDRKAATATSEQAQAGLEAARTRVDQATAGLTASKAQLTQAMAGVESANSLLYQAQAGVEAKEGLVQQAQGAVDEVNAYLESVVLKAPMDGTVTGINSEVGELVSTGTQIAIVSNLQGTWVEVSVPETELGQISEGQEVDIKVPSYPDQTFTGKVSTINAEPNFAVKRATNDNGGFDIVSFGVKIKIDNKEVSLRPGMSAYIQFKN